MPADRPVLLSGGNPRIAKGDGDAPVQAWIAAAPGWKGATAREIDALVATLVPDVRKAVRWNSPFYGREGMGWFLGLHAMTRYLKLTFFRGTELTPPPPVTMKDPLAACLHLHEGETVDTPELRAWITQAAAREGWRP